MQLHLTENEAQIIREALHLAATSRSERVRFSLLSHSSIRLSDDQRAQLRGEADDMLALRERLRRAIEPPTTTALSSSGNLPEHHKGVPNPW